MRRRACTYRRRGTNPAAVTVSRHTARYAEIFGVATHAISAAYGCHQYRGYKTHHSEVSRLTTRSEARRLTRLTRVTWSTHSVKRHNLTSNGTHSRRCRGRCHDTGCLGRWYYASTADDDGTQSYRTARAYERTCATNLNGRGAGR